MMSYDTEIPKGDHDVDTQVPGPLVLTAGEELTTFDTVAIFSAVPVFIVIISIVVYFI